MKLFSEKKKIKSLYFPGVKIKINLKINLVKFFIKINRKV